MARRIDEVQLVFLARWTGVVERYALRLDRDATFAFEIHGIENLRFHFALAQAATHLDKTVRQRGLAVIDVGNNGEVANVLHEWGISGADGPNAAAKYTDFAAKNGTIRPLLPL